MKKTSRSDDFPELLTGGEAQRLAGLSQGIWAELFETMRLPSPIEIGGRLKWRKSDILDWIARQHPVILTAPTAKPSGADHE